MQVLKIHLKHNNILKVNQNIYILYCKKNNKAELLGQEVKASVMRRQEAPQVLMRRAPHQ